MTREQSKNWEFWIDVGGTFTDCLARSPQGDIQHCKVLSSGVIVGKPDGNSSYSNVVDQTMTGYGNDFFTGYKLKLIDNIGRIVDQRLVTGFDPHQGAFFLNHSFQSPPANYAKYQLCSGEEAPVVCIRKIMQIGLNDPIENVRIYLGTTLGTNALLERKGTPTALVITNGFSDLFEIGNQTRRHLFKLDIEKPQNLYHQVVEVEERIDARGNILIPLNEKKILSVLVKLRKKTSSIAICLLNSYQNPLHETLISNLATQIGFEYVSMSSQISPTIKLLNRGHTTIIDAYLSPVLNDYFSNLSKKLVNGELRFMTSFGGLVKQEFFTGKDCILSGPAGGVIGFSASSIDAGYDQCIGFDMGGTSTDVCLFNKCLEYEYETEKAGIPIVAPLLKIETVAAGGGSICRFDGQKLTVGPDSAGSFPGPACYGNGGPLTITDMNLITGKINEEYFPFSLNLDIVTSLINALGNEVTDKTGIRYDIHQIADGFIKIANETMAAAIKRISTDCGIDPTKFILYSFGGAGAQHACVVAELLGIQKILLNPLGGILSAFGIGKADVKRFAEETVLYTLNHENLMSLEKQLIAIEQRLYQEVCDEGIPKTHIKAPQRAYDLRYAGEESTITVYHAEANILINEFERLHTRLYGYAHNSRDVEIVNIRVSITGSAGKISLPESTPGNKVLVPASEKKMFIGGRLTTVAMHYRHSVEIGNKIEGPAIIAEPYSTIIIDPQWSGKIIQDGHLLLEYLGKDIKKYSTTDSKKCDPIRLELFCNEFTNIALKMGIVLQKSAISVNVKERLDFSCAVLDKDGNLIVNAPHIPVHLGAMADTVKGLLNSEVSLRPGDVFLSNAPDVGGSHLPDLTVMTPMFDKKGNTLLFFVASRAHHAEIGGVYPGSIFPFAKNLGEEGVVFRNFKLVDNQIFQEQSLTNHLSSALYPSRNPYENIADIQAAIAANNSGVNELLSLIEDNSWPVVDAYMIYIREAAGQKSREAIRMIEDGTYEFQDCLDDGANIQLKVNVVEDSITFDFSGSAGVNSTTLNANSAIIKSVLLYCLRCIIDEEIPLNSGVLEPVNLILPVGMLNPPVNPDPSKQAAVVGGNVEISQRIVDVVFGALGIVAASQGTMNNFVFGNSKFGYYETLCGGTGAGPKFQGSSAIHSHMTNTRLTDIEILEKFYPIQVQKFKIRKNSGGKAKFNGGDGVIRQIKFLAPLDVSLLTQRRCKGPFGLNGGQGGKKGRNILIEYATGKKIKLGSLAQIKVSAGDELVIETPGGGGWGKDSKK